MQRHWMHLTAVCTRSSRNRGGFKRGKKPLLRNVREVWVTKCLFFFALRSVKATNVNDLFIFASFFLSFSVTLCLHRPSPKASRHNWSADGFATLPKNRSSQASLCHTARSIFPCNSQLKLQYSVFHLPALCLQGVSYCFRRFEVCKSLLKKFARQSRQRSFLFWLTLRAIPLIRFPYICT